MFCGKCGAKIEAGTKFCSNCGAGVEQKNVSVVEDTNKNSKGKIGLIIFLVVIIAVLVGAGVWFAGKNAEPENNNDSLDAQETGDMEDDVNETEQEEEKKAVLKSMECIGVGDSKSEYDEYGNLIYFQTGNGDYQTWEYEYSANNDPLTSITKYYEDGNLESEEKVIYTYEYNEKGDPIIVMEETYDKDGTLIVETTYEYDQTGTKKMYEIHYDANGEITKQFCREWNANGDEIRYENGRYSRETECVYDENGNILERHTVYPYEFYDDHSTYYVYDENGNILESHTIFEDEEHSDYWNYYECDEAGNVLTCYMYSEDNELMSTIYYTYYD